jgi:RNA polymerase sigma factor (sigma-70 family)
LVSFRPTRPRRKLTKAEADWEQITAFDRYLLRAVRNEAQNLYRQRRRRWQRDLNAVRPTAAHDPVPDVDVLAAVAALTLQQRAVVFLTYWAGMSEAEIASELGLARSTIHRSLTRARVTLGKAL